MRLQDSKFWTPLWNTYSHAPSIAFCRVPELEYASRLNANVEMLDHCCGDGLFASMAWPGKKVSAGCDIDLPSVQAAKSLGIYSEVHVADAAKRLPFEDGRFQLVFNNSALEHIPDVDGAIAEVSRVMAPGGNFVFNVLNHRYFAWWPMSRDSLDSYARWQPFVHALSLDQWKALLDKHGLEIASVDEYFGRSSSKMLAWLDHSFSSVSLGKQKNTFVALYRSAFIRRGLRYVLSRMSWTAEKGKGAGLCISSIKR